MNNSSEEWKNNFQKALSDYQKPGMNLPWADIQVGVMKAHRKKIAFYWLGAVSAAAVLAIFFISVFNVPKPSQQNETELLASDQSSEKDLTSILEEPSITEKKIYENELPVKTADRSSEKKPVEKISSETEWVAQILPPSIENDLPEQTTGSIPGKALPESSKESRETETTPPILGTYLDDDFGVEEIPQRRDPAHRLSTSVYAGNPWNNSISVPTARPMLMAAETFHPTHLNSEPETSVPFMNPSNSLHKYERYYQPIRYGFTVDYQMKHGFSIGTGLYSSVLRSHIGYSFNEKNGNETKQTLWYLGVPLQMSYQFVHAGPFYAYTTVGGMAEMMVNGKKEIRHLDNGELKKVKLTEHPWQFSANANLGLALKVIDLMSVYVEPGISYYFKNNSEIESFYTKNRWAFSMNVGLRFHFQ